MFNNNCFVCYCSSSYLCVRFLRYGTFSYGFGGFLSQNIGDKKGEKIWNECSGLRIFAVRFYGSDLVLKILIIKPERIC
jgi:hypothetical protein